MFAPGERPLARAIAALAQSDSGFTVSLDGAGVGGPDGPGGGPGPDIWLELLASGLTFDLVGLAPGSAAPLPPHGHSYGLASQFEAMRVEAITLRLGPHLATGPTMLPVVRTLAWLAARLTALPGVRALAWHAARCWSAPEFFRDSVLRWIEGGAFPGLGLAALTPALDGGMQSEGLALFIGQELRLEPELTGDQAAAARIGLRLLHWLVENGRLTAPETLAGPDGQSLRLEPSPNGRFVRAWRG